MASVRDASERDAGMRYAGASFDVHQRDPGDACESAVGARSQRPIVLEGACVRSGATVLLHPTDLQICVSRRTVVLGPNGAGKTTLLRAIHGLVGLAGGALRGVARDSASASRGEGARCAYVFQKPVMLHRSALANVEHALALNGVIAGERRNRAQAALADVGLASLGQRPARRLSGGEQQRLAVARANALDPDCLLLDEPTASLDPGAAAGIERYLLRLCERGRGFVMTTHDLAQARRLADRIIFMHRGRVEEASEAAAFFDAPSSTLARRFLEGEWLE
ncbi:MAG: ATP-binding cassette domain-containing protein [Burkholderiaceae bacterium]|nr:ATP-binding cassette domain-containing protein [Burkholderiaceae bacterium]